MANNSPVSLPNIFAGLTLTIHNVGAANEIEATGSFGTWFFDAGLPRGKKVVLSAPVNIFFLTHWHTDHYSIFLDPRNTFYNFVGPVIRKKTGSLINFVIKLMAMSLPQKHCYFTDSALRALMQSYPNLLIQKVMGNLTDPNNCGLIYTLDVTGLNVRASSTGNSSKALGPFVLPGDASEDDVPYSGVPWAFLVIPHHGSPHSLASWASAFSFNHVLLPSLFCSTRQPDTYCSLSKGRYSSGGGCLWESTGSNGGKNIVLTFK